MKKTYQKPRIKVKGIEVQSLMAASDGISVGGNAGVGTGEGDGGHTQGSAKGNSFFNFYDEPTGASTSSSIWED